jgi:DNA mismatch repair ATPase MutS
MKKKIVGNELEAKGKHLIVVTGANQGGKSSFLRSIGVAQIMMQSGCFVAADSFSANLRTNAATHYKKEEDPSMTRGKLDEELSRLNDIATHLTPGSLVLFNESFGSTNEREGSEIARQVTSAFLDKGIKVFFVTHLTEFARGLFETSQDEVTFLRAERKPDGSRTFKLIPGEPLLTSYGEDLYQEIFLKNESSPSRGKLHA